MFFAAVAAVAGVIALIAVPYAVIGYFKANPRRQLLYSVTSRPLIAKADVPQLKVTVGDETINDPHFVEFRLSSTSRADITSAHFDAGKPIEIELDAHGVLVSSSENGIEVASWEMDGWASVIATVDPQLIRRGAFLAIDFVSEGDAKIVVRESLIDVKVKRITDRRALLAFTDNVLESGLLPFSGLVSALRRVLAP